MINLSICINRRYTAIVILENGREIFHEVKKLPESDKRHYTEKYLELFKKSLFLLKSVISQEKLSFDQNLVIETRSSRLIDCFKSLSATKSQSKLFIDALKEFESLPFRYMFSYNEKPTSLYYAEERYVKKDTYVTAKDLF